MKQVKQRYMKKLLFFAIGLIALVVLIRQLGSQSISPDASDEKVISWTKKKVAEMIKDSLPSGYTMKIKSWEDISIFTEKKDNNTITIGTGYHYPGQRCLLSRHGETNEEEWDALKNGAQIDPSKSAPIVEYADPDFAISISKHKKVIGAVVSYTVYSEMEGEKEIWRYFFLDYDGKLLERGKMYETCHGDR